MSFTSTTTTEAATPTPPRRSLPRSFHNRHTPANAASVTPAQRRSTRSRTATQTITTLPSPVIPTAPSSPSASTLPTLPIASTSKLPSTSRLRTMAPLRRSRGITNTRNTTDTTPASTAPTPIPTHLPSVSDIPTEVDGPGPVKKRRVKYPDGKPVTIVHDPQPSPAYLERNYGIKIRDFGYDNPLPPHPFVVCYCVPMSCIKYRPRTERWRAQRAKELARQEEEEARREGRSIEREDTEPDLMSQLQPEMGFMLDEDSQMEDVDDQEEEQEEEEQEQEQEGAGTPIRFMSPGSEVPVPGDDENDDNTEPEPEPASQTSTITEDGAGSGPTTSTKAGGIRGLLQRGGALLGLAPSPDITPGPSQPKPQSQSQATSKPLSQNRRPLTRNAAMLPTNLTTINNSYTVDRTESEISLGLDLSGAATSQESGPDSQLLTPSGSQYLDHHEDDDDVNMAYVPALLERVSTPPPAAVKPPTQPTAGASGPQTPEVNNAHLSPHPRTSHLRTPEQNTPGPAASAPATLKRSPAAFLFPTAGGGLSPGRARTRAGNRGSPLVGSGAERSKRRGQPPHSAGPIIRTVDEGRKGGLRRALLPPLPQPVFGVNGPTPSGEVDGKGKGKEKEKGVMGGTSKKRSAPPVDENEEAAGGAAETRRSRHKRLRSDASAAPLPSDKGKGKSIAKGVKDTTEHRPSRASAAGRPLTSALETTTPTAPNPEPAGLELECRESRGRYPLRKRGAPPAAAPVALTAEATNTAKTPRTKKVRTVAVAGDKSTTRKTKTRKA